MTTLAKLELKLKELNSLVIQLKKEDASLGKRYLVFTMTEAVEMGGQIRDEQTCIWTYEDMLNGVTKEQKLAEFVEKRKKELNLC